MMMMFTLMSRIEVNWIELKWTIRKVVRLVCLKAEKNWNYEFFLFGMKF